MKTIETHVFLDDFEVEAKTHIENIEAAFLNADALSGDSKLMDSVFRNAHSLKGTAGFFSLKKIVDVAHELESVFSQINSNDLKIDDEIVDTVLQAVDCLRELIDIAPDDGSVETTQLLDKLRSLSGVVTYEDKNEIRIPFKLDNPEVLELLTSRMRHGHKVYYVVFDFIKSLGVYYTHPKAMFDSISSIGNIVEALIGDSGTDGLRTGDKKSRSIKNQNCEAVSEQLVEVLNEHDFPTVELLVTSVLEPSLFSIATELNQKHIHLLSHDLFLPSAKKSSVPGKQSTESFDSVPAMKPRGGENSFSMRLDISVINGLLDLANEMILTRNQLLSTTSKHTKDIAGLAPILHDMSRLTGEIQEKVMYTRMQPISVIFDKFPRIIRDTARVLGKDITVEIQNGTVTLDRYLLESLSDPITQIVKNSADHGLEHTEQRLAAGKPRTGTITLNANMHDGSAFIEIKDDGAGIDTNALKRKAIENKIITEEKAAAATKSELYDLIFEPGISTAKQITNTSGRGVGMDIVKTNIEKLGGTIELESEPGKSTTTRIKVPLTLSVIRALLVMIDNIPYAVPDLYVERIVRISDETPSKRLDKINKSIVLSLDGQMIPVVTMGEIEAVAGGFKPVSAKTALKQYQRDGITKCLVLGTGGKFFALLIDDALDTEQILVKSLPMYFQNCPFYSNVTVLGNGKAVMILDVEGIIRFMNISGSEIRNIHMTGEVFDEQSENYKQVIIFKCSEAENYAVCVGDISRIERINASDIQVVGKNSYVNIGAETVQLIRPEDYAPVKKQRYKTDELYVLTLKNSATPAGLLAAEVIDKIDGGFELNKELIPADYIMGTCAYNGKVLIFLDTNAIIEKAERDKGRKK